MSKREKSQSVAEYLLLMAMVVSAIWLFCKPGGPFLNNVLPNIIDGIGDYPPIPYTTTVFEGPNPPGPWGPHDNSWNSGNPPGVPIPTKPRWVYPNEPAPGWIPGPAPAPTGPGCPGCPPPPPCPGCCPGCAKPGIQGKLEKEKPAGLIITGVPDKFMTDTLSDLDSLDPSEDFVLIKDPLDQKDAKKANKNLKLTSGRK